MASVATLTDTSIIGENEEQLVTMIVDNQLFGIPILQVQDIVEASRITPVPLAPSAIAGVLNLRGRIVTVIDLRKLLGNFEEVPWDSQMGVTVEHRGDLYTLLVDAIGDVRTLPKRDFDSAPSTMEEKVRQLCSGIFRLRGNLLVVLDVGRILQPGSIEATPMLTVEERRSRKQAAQAESQDQQSDKSRQLSQLMTDLNSYETDFESGLDSLSGDSDDMKARKKANRNRRPVGERWREVLEEKARREGITVYRMREPDEETLEEAREDAERQQDEWEAEWQARQEGTYRSRLDQIEDQAQLPSGHNENGTGDGAVTAAAQPDRESSSFGNMAPDGGEISDGADSEASDWWNKMRGKAGSADSGPGKTQSKEASNDKPESEAAEDSVTPEQSSTSDDSSTSADSSGGGGASSETASGAETTDPGEPEPTKNTKEDEAGKGAKNSGKATGKAASKSKPGTKAKKKK